MHLRRTFTAYVVTLALCLLFLSGRMDPEPPLDTQWQGGPADVLVPEGADGPPEALATPKGSRVVEALDLGDSDIPLTALLAYRRAAGILAEVQPTCELSWTLLAAIGRVESNHGRYAGATLNTDGVSTPQVVGVALNGDGPVAKIPDTDGGRLDDDRRWDRAVGPMQFIPSTWEMVGVDGDGDGVRSVHDIDDAALAAGVYLCAGSDNLSEPAAMEAALYRYNDSDPYVALVMAYEKAYRTGDFAVETASGPVTAAALAGPTLGATPLPKSARLPDKVRARVAAEVRAAVADAAEAGATTPGVSASSSRPTGSPSAGVTPGEGRSTTPSTGATDESGAGGGTTTSDTPAAPSGGAAGPAPSDPVPGPSQVPTQSTPSTPSDPAPDSPSAGSPTPDPTPDVCETESPDAEPTPTPTPTPSPEPSADATADPDDPCKPTESPSTATASPGP